MFFPVLFSEEIDFLGENPEGETLGDDGVLLLPLLLLLLLSTSVAEETLVFIES